VLHESNPNPVRILIAAPQPSLIALLRRRLESEQQIEVVGVAADSNAALALTRSLAPDILLIASDLNREYWALCASGRNHAPSNVRVIAIIESIRIQDIVEAFEFGATGIVLRSALPQLWLPGIRNVMAGQYWVEDKSVALLLDTARTFLGGHRARALPEFGLTDREVEIAGKIAAGRSNKEVGVEFSICERTVKHHLTNIFRKVGVSSRLELAVFVRDKISGDSPNMAPARDQSHKQGERRKLSVINGSRS
jgi:DNA-binding NarL/FixJ family response regulator